MKIAYTSDLHADFGPTNRALLEPLAARAAELQPDVFVVAGDVAETAAGVTECLHHFAAVPGRKLFVAGNHDLYVEGTAALRAAVTSRIKFERILPAAAAAVGFEFLGHRPIDVGAATFVGVPGWYDYTMRDPGLDVFVSLQHYRAGLWRGQRAFDRGHVLWENHPGRSPDPRSAPWLDDESLCAHMLELLDAQLRAAASDRPLVAVVHVLPCLELVQRGRFGTHAFHEAWLGSVRFGERLQSDARVRAVITGHLHLPADRRLANLRVVAAPIGNLRDPQLDLERFARERLGWLEL